MVQGSTKKEAFEWIIGVLEKNQVKFLISGGLAAKAYGSKRDLRDFDIEIPNDDFPKIMKEVRPHIVSGPELHQSQAFQNMLLKLIYKGQGIDIAGGNGAKIYDDKSNKWTDDPVDFNRFELKEIFGRKVPVMNPEDLIAYKSKVPRKEDLEDIEATKDYLSKK